jgi:hypothetical protein
MKPGGYLRCDGNRNERQSAARPAKISAAGIPEPGTLITADDIPAGEPDAAPYLLAAKRLGSDPAASQVIEDSPAGVQSGLAAGMQVLGLRTTYIHLDGPQWLVDSLTSLRLLRREPQLVCSRYVSATCRTGRRLNLRSISNRPRLARMSAGTCHDIRGLGGGSGMGSAEVMVRGLPGSRWRGSDGWAGESPD